MPSTSTAVEMKIQGTDQASALLDAATQKLARLQGASSKASHKLRDAALGAGKALLFTGPLAALRSLRRGLLATSATAAALAYATDRAAARFGTLSDQAAQAGATADEITRLSLALQQAGVRAASVDTLASALARMAKTTGRTGLAGLRETLAEIAALPDEAARVVALSESFGKALGPQFAALVRQGPDALKAGLDGVVAAMPGVSDAVVDAGDSIADGMASIRSSFVTAWDSTLVSIATKIAEHFGADSFRELGARISAYVQYYADIAIANLGPLWDHLKFWAANLPRLFVAGIQDIGDAIDDYITSKLGVVYKTLKATQQIIPRVAGALGNASAGDWEGAWETLVGSKAERAGTRVGEILGEYTGRAFVGATAEAEEKLAERLAAASGLDEAMGRLATGATAAEDAFDEAADSAADLGKAGVDAARKVTNAWKGADVTMAGSYEALQLAFRNRERGEQTPPLDVSSAPSDSLADAQRAADAIASTDLATPFADAQRAADSLAASASSSAESATSAWERFGASVIGIFGRIEASAKRATAAARATLSAASSSPSSRSSSATDELPQLLQVQRDGWSFLRSSLSSLGVV